MTHGAGSRCAVVAGAVAMVATQAMPLRGLLAVLLVVAAIYDRRSDAYWFLPAIVGKYVGLTRDTGFLDTGVPYWPRSAGRTGSVRDHIDRGLDFALDESLLGVAARGLVAMGTNDYADGVLNLTSERPATPTGTSSTYNAGMIVHGLPLAADVRWPRLRVESMPRSIAGALATEATAPVVLEVLLPSALRGGAPLSVTAAGTTASYALDGDLVRFALPPAPATPVAWRVEDAA